MSNMPLLVFGHMEGKREDLGDDRFNEAAQQYPRLYSVLHSQPDKIVAPPGPNADHELMYLPRVSFTA